MQVHAEPAYDLIRDAFSLGEARPLVLAGGPKAIYEPNDFLEIDPGVGADCSVTGEVYVLLELLETILDERTEGESPRQAFERARQGGLLKDIPGLVYMSPDATPDLPFAINTGVQQLIRDFDEMPMPDAGYRLLEPPHRGRRLKEKPLSPRKIKRLSPIASVITTQGCKFNCSFCPIPAVNQRTWRYKSPKRFAAEIKHLHEEFGITHFFSTDDNFFNRRETVVELLGELGRTESNGKPLGQRVRFYTEATQFDVHKNRDILPMCKEAGLSAIWFGIEDITAELVNKGQTPGKTSEMFKMLRGIGIEPMVMMIHSDDQPLRSKGDNLTGLLNQARYVFKHGAVSYQTTYLGPNVGTRDFEPAAKSRTIYRRVGGEPVPQSFQDGNHIAASGHPRPWEKQINILRGYAAFYNPINTVRALLGVRRDAASQKRLIFQFVGQIGLLMTVPKLLRWAWKLKRGPIEVWDGLQPSRLPMVDAHTGQEVNWGIEHLPTPGLPTPAEATPAAAECPESRPVVVPATALEA
jgi:hypothetical protein